MHVTQGGLLWFCLQLAVLKHMAQSTAGVLPKRSEVGPHVDVLRNTLQAACQSDNAPFSSVCWRAYQRDVDLSVSQPHALLSLERINCRLHLAYGQHELEAIFHHMVANALFDKKTQM